MDGSRLRQHIDDLLADFERQGSLSEDDFLRLASRRRLSPEDIEAVLRALRVEGIDLEPAEVIGYDTAHPLRTGGNENALLKIYLKEIGEARLLTARDEVALARRIQAGLAARRTASAGGTTSPAIRRLIEDGELALSQLVTANLRLVFSIAKKYARRGHLELLDLAQNGVIGLTRAGQLFDPSKGFKFSTYATWWIRQSIFRGTDDTERTIRLPVHVIESIRRIRKVRRALMRENGGVEPRLEEIAEQVNKSPDKVQFLLDVAAEPLSLDAPVRGDLGDDTIASLVPARMVKTPEDLAAAKELTDSINSILTVLKPKEARVLRLRFGLDDGHERTLEEVGAILGVTRERVRQIQVKGLKRLRFAPRRKLIATLTGRLDQLQDTEHGR